MSDYIIANDSELYHYGVLGMKWGKRKAVYDSETKANYKSAKKSRDEAKVNYKQAKSERKQKINSAYKEINKNVGEKMLYNNATRKKAAKYVVDHNMSISEATKKANAEAKRNTAIAVSAYAAYTVYKVGTFYAINQLLK